MDFKDLVPGAKRPPLRSLDNTVIWIVGEPKIGKTTLASQFPGAWFWATEMGQNFVECREPTIISSWKEFKTTAKVVDDALKALPKDEVLSFADGTPILNIVIDVFDKLHDMCQVEVCAGLGIDDPGELPHGQGWSRLKLEFSRVMNKIALWPFGLILISHGREKERVVNRIKSTRTEPYVGASGLRWGVGAADLILYCFAKNVPRTNSKGEIVGTTTVRKMLAHPTDWAVAGGRMSDMLPKELDLDYDALLEHFKDTSTEGEEEEEEGTEPAQAKGRSKAKAKKKKTRTSK